MVTDMTKDTIWNTLCHLVSLPLKETLCHLVSCGALSGIMTLIGIFMPLMCLKPLSVLTSANTKHVITKVVTHWSVILFVVPLSWND